MIKITPSPALRAEVTRLARMTGQLEFAAALALTRTAQAVKAGLESEIDRVFDRPTRWTRGALFLQSAKKNRLEAKVWIKDGWGWKTTAPERWLRPQIYGGQREMKRFERALVARGIMPAGMYAIPASGAQLDAHGNMSRGQIVQIMSYFGAFGEQGYRANMTDKRKANLAKARGGKNARAGMAYFALQKPHGGLKPGVYQRLFLAHGRAVRPVLVFVKRAQYQQRLNFFGIGRRVADERLPDEFKKALAQALATAR